MFAVDGVIHRARSNVIKTLATVGVFFVVCWTPNEVCYVAHFVGYPLVDFTSTFYNSTVLLVFAISLVNPVIYAVRYRQVR